MSLCVCFCLREKKEEKKNQTSEKVLSRGVSADLLGDALRKPC